MNKYKTVTKEVQEIDDVICNKCGDSCKHSTGNILGLIDAKCSGGYGSNHFRDGDVYNFSLCEKCCVELFETFKHPAFQWNFLFPEEHMLGTFIIDMFTRCSDAEYLEYTEMFNAHFNEKYNGDLELESIPKEKIWRVKGLMAHLWELQENEDFKKAGFVIAEEIGSELQNK